MRKPVSISAIASISALGISPAAVWQQYLAGRPLFGTRSIQGSNISGAFVSSEADFEIQRLRASNSAYKNLDRSVLLAMLAAKHAFDPQVFPKKNIGINIGSSRGATALFEKHHTRYQKEGKVSPFASPTTTLGNISSWIGQELGASGIRIEHSVTCSTALHAMLNGIAWLGAGMSDAFIAGGSEAALTPFTLAQMKAMKLQSNLDGDFPCESMRFDKKRNTMVLGEGAAVAVLEPEISDRTLAVIRGFGFASEAIAHNSSISENAECFQRSMKMALDHAGLNTVDAIVMHAPGTIKGDLAENNAVEAVFGEKLPFLTSNKWLIGHTFGASGMMSMEMAVLMLRHNRFINNPFYENSVSHQKPLKTMLINAVGFGGNAVSIIISKP